jgi:putative addiction module component (TIGR02574 family)
MALTLDQIVEEVRGWPQDRVVELLDRLAPVVGEEDTAVSQTWKEETRRRIKEIERGEVEGIPGEKVSAKIRRLVGR